MTQLTIHNIRAFMHQLLLTDTFDAYGVSEAAITTFTTVSFDGSYHPAFYGKQAAGEPDAPQPAGSAAPAVVRPPQATWGSIRPLCLTVMKGKRLPLAFHMVLQLPGREVADMVQKQDLALAPSDVYGLFLNIQYRDEVLTVTTGSSLRVFTLDRSLDKAWDARVRDALTARGLVKDGEV